MIPMHDPNTRIADDVIADALGASLGLADQPTIAELGEAVDALSPAQALACLRSVLLLAGLDVDAALEAP